MRETLGEHIFDHFLAAKREEWFDYIKHVSPWEVERYLADVLTSGGVGGLSGAGSVAHSKGQSRLPRRTAGAGAEIDRIFLKEARGTVVDDAQVGRVGSPECDYSGRRWHRRIPSRRSTIRRGHFSRLGGAGMHTTMRNYRSSSRASSPLAVSRCAACCARRGFPICRTTRAATRPHRQRRTAW